MRLRTLFCLMTTLQLAACAAPPQQAHFQTEPVVSEMTTPVEALNITLPSAPVVAPQAERADVVAANSVEPVAPRSNCQVNFEDIMADATKKIQSQRPM